MWKWIKKYIIMRCVAGVAQLVEHLIRNEGVVGSSPITGTRIKKNAVLSALFFLHKLKLFLQLHRILIQCRNLGLFFL